MLWIKRLCSPAFLASLASFASFVAGQSEDPNEPQANVIDLNGGFKIILQDKYHILNNTIANKVYGVYTDEQPKDDQIDQWFKAPVESVGSDFVHIVGYLEALSEQDSLKAVSDPQDVVSRCIDLSNLKTLNDTQEDLDIVFRSEETNKTHKNTAIVSASNDMMPIQAASWLVYISYFFDKQQTAMDLYKQIRSNYLCHQNNIKKIQKKKTISIIELQKLWASNVYTLVNQTFFFKLISDSGAKLLNSSQHVFTNPTDFHNALDGTDIVVDLTNLNGTSISSTQQWLDEYKYSNDSSKMPAFIKEDTWRVDAIVNDHHVTEFSNYAFARPDLALQDFIAIQYPSYDSSYTPRWIRRLSDNASPKSVYDDPSSCQSTWSQSITRCYAHSFVANNDDSEEAKSDSKSAEKSVSSNNDSEKKGGIAGGVLGVIALIVIAVVGMHYINKYRRQRKRADSFLSLDDEHDAFQLSDHV